MELCIHLEQLPDGKLKLSPQRVANLRQAPPVTVDLPFTETEIAAVSRALDVNTGFKRTVSSSDARLLWQWDVLSTPPQADEKLTLSKKILHVETLRKYVRARLYQTLIGALEAPLREHFAAMRVDPEDTDKILHIRLEIAAEHVELFQYPWELLHHDDSLGGEIHLSRYIRYLEPLEPLQAVEKWRLLVLHSEPEGLPKLNVRDWQTIKEAFKKVPYGSRFEVEYIDAATPTRLTDALDARRDMPTIVHFAGHGEFGRRCEGCGQLSLAPEPEKCAACGRSFPRQLGAAQGYLAFSDEQTGGVKWISAPVFCNMLQAGKVQLVVLNACKTALGRGGDDVFNGMAQHLVYRIPAVVATPFPLDNQGAMEFARCFCEGLGRGYSLVGTLSQVRRRMSGSYPDEWYRPVLYLRSDQKDGGYLLAMAEAVPLTSPTTQTAKPRAVSPELIPYFINYDDQEILFKNHIEAHRTADNPNRGRPLICLMHGHADAGAAENLVKRLRYQLEREQFERDYDPRRMAIEMHSITTDRPGEFKRIYTLDGQLHDFLEKNTRRRLLAENQDDKILCDQVLDRPHVFFIHLELEHLRPLQDIAAFLHNFHRFWGKWHAQRHLFLVCVFINHIKPPMRLFEHFVHLRWKNHNARLVRELTAFRATGTHTESKLLSTLALIDRRQAEEWSEQMGRKNVFTNQARVDAKIVELFARQTAIPLGELCDELEYCL